MILTYLWGKNRCAKYFFPVIGIPSGQIGSAWEWYHWIGLKKSSTTIGFWFFNFSYEFLKKLWSSEPLHSKINPTSCLFGSWFVYLGTNRNLFHRTVIQKCLKLFFGLRLVRRIFQDRNPNQNRGALWRFFSTNKSAPANGKKRLCTNRDPNKQEVGFFFVWVGSELWSLFKYSKLKLKIKKLMSFSRPIQWYHTVQKL